MVGRVLSRAVIEMLASRGVALVGLIAFAIPGAAVGEGVPGKFDIKIGGDAYATAGYVSENYDRANGNTGNVAFANSFRINVTPSATADNGMEYGASLRIRAYLSTGELDAQRAYLFVDGRYGRFEAGLAAGPNEEYGVTAPSGFGTGGVVGDWSTGPGWIKSQNTFLEPYFGGGFDSITDTSWATRVTYFTPRAFSQEASGSGLMASVAFAPRVLSVGAGVNRSSVVAATQHQSYCAATEPASPLSGCGYSNVVEPGLRYDGKVAGVGISASAGYEHSAAPRDTTGVVYHALSAYQAGVLLDYAGFEVGGSWLNAGKSSYASNQGYFLDDQIAITAGISYQTGPLTVGFNYAYGQDAGDVTVPGKRTADLYAVGATYVLAPGLSTSIEYMRSLTHNEAGYGADPFGNDAMGTPTSSGGTGYGSSNAHMALWKTRVAF